MRLNEQKLNIAMAKARLTVYGLCEAADIQYQTLRRIMRGHPCKPITAGKISAALGIDIEDLIEKEEEKA